MLWLPKGSSLMCRLMGALTVIVVVFALAAPADAQGAKSINPRFDCVWLNADGSWMSVWKYKNPGGVASIPIGSNNTFTGSPSIAANQGQFTTFLAAQTPSSTEFFVVTMPASQTSITWYVSGNSLTASRPTSSSCASQPVSLLGAGPQWLSTLGVFGFVVGISFLAARRAAQGKVMI